MQKLLMLISSPLFLLLFLCLRRPIKKNILLRFLSKSTKPMFFPRSSVVSHLTFVGFPGGSSSKESACEHRRHKRYEFDP